VPPLDGGTRDFFGGSGGPPFGTLVPPNLTPAGPLADWSDGEVIRAIREGVDRNGRPLLIMPADQFHRMSDEDVQSVVAYLRSQPPVQHVTPEMEVNLLGAIVIGAGIFPTTAQPPITQPVVAPPRGPTAAYGKYLVDISGCHACHGDNLTGGTNQYTPKGPNLTLLVPKWPEADFLNTIRTGVDPTGYRLNPDRMP
jgi:mono/diheme cytochrome c family protein